MTLVLTCPEDGATLTLERPTKSLNCSKCGLTFTGDDLRNLRKRTNPGIPESPEEKRRREQSDYLAWWLGPK